MDQDNFDGDFTDSVDATATPAWRKRAVELAAERGLVGQAYTIMPGRMFGCASAHEPRDYKLAYDARTGTISCQCQAGQHITPCGHAGAALLLITHLAPERERSPEGGPREPVL